MDKHNNLDNLIIYNNGEIELAVSVDKETIWLRQDEISKLFEKDRTVITRHINNILKEKEVDEQSNVRKMHFANSDKPVKLYSLDIILAIGYRTNSAKAIRFRQWATQILKQYIYTGYTINSEKITHQRFKELEKDVRSLKHKIKEINSKIKDDTVVPTQGIFYDGQIYDAYAFINNLFKNTKNEIILIDNYLDDTVLTIFSKYPKLKYTVITKNLPKQLKLDVQKYNSQYNNLIIKTSNKYHDRFLILDNKEIYHIGASLKDLGKKVFGLSRFEIDIFDFLKRLS